jgi:hypothetical protein
VSDEVKHQEVIREAAATLGRARTPRKAASSRENGKLSEETKAKMREAQKARREREQGTDSAEAE